MLNPEIDKINNISWKLRYSDPTEAYTLAKKVLEASKNTNYETGKAIANLNLAFYHFLKSENEKAFRLIDKSTDHFEESGEPCWGYIAALHLKGNLFEGFGDYDKALKLTTDSLRMAKEINYEEGIADSSSVLGIIYTRLKEYSKAYEALKQCLEIREKQDDMAGLASVLNRIGMVLTYMKNFDKAKLNYEHAIRIRKELNQHDSLLWSYLGIANLYRDSNKENKAVEFFTYGLELSSKGGDDRCNLQCMLGLADILINNKKTAEAENYITKALDLSLKIKSRPLEADARLLKSRLLEIKGEHKDALHQYKLYHEIKESILNEDSRRQIRQLHISHAIEDSKKEAELHRVKNIELKHAYKEIRDSVNYASRIQSSILPNIESVKKILPESFIFFRPHSVVSGDFYFVEDHNDKIYFSAVDCTGHGIPGGFMSMLGYYILSQAINEKHLSKPNEILSCLDENINNILRQSDIIDGAKDGMDLGFCVLNREKMILEYAGAYNGLYLVRQKSDDRSFKQFEEHKALTIDNYTLVDVKADKLPIGGNIDGIVDQYTLHTFNLKKGDTLYLYSDGYADQFGGPTPNGKKFMYKRLKKLLLSIQDKTMEEQYDIIEKSFDDWIGNHNQTDDVIVFGVRV